MDTEEEGNEVVAVNDVREDNPQSEEVEVENVVAKDDKEKATTKEPSLGSMILIPLRNMELSDHEDDDKIETKDSATLDVKQIEEEHRKPNETQGTDNEEWDSKKNPTPVGELSQRRSVVDDVIEVDKPSSGSTVTDKGFEENKVTSRTEKGVADVVDVAMEGSSEAITVQEEVNGEATDDVVEVPDLDDVHTVEEDLDRGLSPGNVKLQDELKENVVQEVEIDAENESRDVSAEVMEVDVAGNPEEATAEVVDLENVEDQDINGNEGANDSIVLLDVDDVVSENDHEVSVVEVEVDCDVTSDNESINMLDDSQDVDGSIVSELDTTDDAVGDVSLASVDQSGEDDDDDMPEIIDDVPSARTRSGRVSMNDSLNLSVSSLDLGKEAAALAGTKCPNCRQRLNVVKNYKPKPGRGEEEVIKDPMVNIMMDEEDQRALQYKLTDFAVYDKPSSESGGHLVPIFAESLLSTGKKIYLSGKVLRLDSQEGDEGLQVVDIGPITEWTNMTGMEGGQENIILGTRSGGKDIEFNLLKPCDEYLSMYKTTYRMVYMANSIIIELISCNENGGFMEYAELLEFIDKLDPPVLYGEILPRCDEEFLQLHSDFIVSQVSSFEDAGDVEEDLTILGMPCIKHISDMAGVERAPARRRPVRREGMVGSTPQPETHVQAITTPLVAELFESTFQKQMKLNRAAKAKVCTCKACQANNCGRCERCREMVSFGGVEADSTVTCLERQCLRRNDQEVVLGDEDREETRKDEKTKVKWVGKGMAAAGGKTYYREVLLKFGSTECKVGAGDFLLVAPDSAEHKSVPHYPCRVLYLLTREMQGVNFECAHVQWLCRSEHTVLGRTGDPREWFLINECEDVVLSEVTKVMKIEQLKVDDLKRWKRLGGTKGAIVEADKGGKDGWWRMKYMPEFGRFEYPKDEELELGKDGGDCYFCKDVEEQLKAEQVEVGDDGNSVRIKNLWFNVGQYIMLEDDTIRCNIPKKEPKVYPKAKVDAKLYPEHWRKKDEYEGDHYDTWDPFQVVRLEQIVQEKQEVFLRVRKMYRPHDTHMVHEVARTKAYSCLYWTGEIARMHLPEFAKRTGKVSMESVVGRAWLKGQQGGNVEKLMEWTDEGEDRFFISESYNSVSKTFSPLEAEVVADMKSILSSCPAPYIAEVPPLACLDIFAGCGGLSRGLHESGVTQHKWAIEFWPPSAEAFKKNNPDCVVLNEECNGLLSKAMKGEKGTRMPGKGEVDIMVGGPPCQGFSLLNIYKEREYSKFKNSLIPTYLSFCDFYRPRYYILENVRNLVANENGMVLKLILATLVKMGYQVGFNILQAGHYGVAQTRRRLIVLAAAPGEVLPVYPEPVHCFQGPHFQEIEVDGRKFSTTSTRPGAPRRALTCWDAISDLPPISSGHAEQSIPYAYKVKGKMSDGKHVSHMQKMFKSLNPPGQQLEDHICKDVNALCLERIRHVPTTPGSDWRDLPNTTIKLDDGRVTKKLHYPYKKADGSRGVCSCSLSTKKRMHFCDADDKQSETMIAWSLPHTADRHNNWQGVYGRVPWDGIFKTTITDPEPLGKQGQVVHPEQDRLLSVREYARSQGFKDNFKFAGTIRDKHREIGNAVPPPMGKAVGMEIKKAILKRCV